VDHALSFSFFNGFLLTVSFVSFGCRFVLFCFSLCFLAFLVYPNALPDTELSVNSVTGSMLASVTGGMDLAENENKDVR